MLNMRTRMVGGGPGVAERRGRGRRLTADVTPISLSVQRFHRAGPSSVTQPKRFRQSLQSHPWHLSQVGGPSSPAPPSSSGGPFSAFICLPQSPNAWPAALPRSWPSAQHRQSAPQQVRGLGGRCGRGVRFTGVRPVQSHRTQHSEGPVLGLMLCCLPPKIPAAS